MQDLKNLSPAERGSISPSVMVKGLIEAEIG
jgi:hypothetical protein